VELEHVCWYCALCEQRLTVEYSGPRIPFMESPKKAALRRLLAKVEDHIDFHCWQFGNEIEYGWLEEEQE
jgi:hypothetical protein